MRIYSTLLLAALASWPFVAEAEVQKCVMQVGESLQGDMIAREIYLIEDPKTKSFMVLDAVVSYFNNKKPMVVRVTADDSVKRVFDWDVFMLNNAGQRTKIAYHGTWFRVTDQLQVQAVPIGFSNNFSANGTCAPDKK